MDSIGRRGCELLELLWMRLCAGRKNVGQASTQRGYR